MSFSVRLDAGLPPDLLWRDVALRTGDWAKGAGVVLRDAVLLVPAASMLGEARRAFAARPGWMPRIETVRTLAASLGPAAAPQPGQLTLDAATDALLLRPVLMRQPLVRDGFGRDSRSQAAAVRQVVALAHDLAYRLWQLPPARRSEWADLARERIGAGSGPDQVERLLARVALEFAVSAPAPLTDALWGLRPSAWLTLAAGAPQPLVEALVETSGVPALRIDADLPHDAPLPAACRPQAIVCDGFEAEAQAAAACVLRHLADGEAPVALIAEDRLLVRRVRALLARRAVPIADETGWKLSTTRAAAAVMTLLRAALPGASTDELLDCLKASESTEGRPGSVDALEAALRRSQWVRIADVDVARLGAEPGRAWQAAIRRLAPLQQLSSRPLAGWLQALLSGVDVDRLRADAAGTQVLQTLARAEAAQADDAPLSLAAFTDWIDASLEDAIFLPEAPGRRPPVVITPLARAMLRPFAAVVLPGADERSLGGMPKPQPLLGNALAVELGLGGIDEQRDSEWRAFRQLLRLPHLVLLRRRLDGDEPLAPSPMLEWLASHGALEVRPAPLASRTVEPAPLRRPLPTPAAVPTRGLSASQVEALRDCPYRFHARVFLRLREADELDDQPDKRDFGTWLHAVLERFHADRVPDDPEAEVRRLVAIGRERMQVDGMDEAAFLPFAIELEPFARRYVAWQHERDAAGSEHVASEVARSVRLEEWPELELHGRIDRIDRERGGAVALLDYKSSRRDDLRSRVREPLEDTQLALYALLEQAGDCVPGATSLTAAYVALDQRDAIALVPHPDVGESARVLRGALLDEMRRVRDGAPLPALGEGRVCENCEMRGLCRRDDWAE